MESLPQFPIGPEDNRRYSMVFETRDHRANKQTIFTVTKDGTPKPIVSKEHLASYTNRTLIRLTNQGDEPIFLNYIDNDTKLQFQLYDLS
jgi:hypothetical protein